MATEQIKAEIQKNVEKLEGLRDEVKLKLHLATLDAKQEWDEKLSPRLAEVETFATNVSESSRNGLSELIGKVEDFVHRLREGVAKSDGAPYSTH